MLEGWPTTEAAERGVHEMFAKKQYVFNYFFVYFLVEKNIKKRQIMAKIGLKSSFDIKILSKISLARKL